MTLQLPQTEQGPGYGGDDARLWACNKWLLAHPDSAEAAQGAYVGLTGINIDISLDNAQ